MNTRRLRILALVLGLGITTLLVAGVVYASAPSNTDLIGTWINVNPNSEGTVKVVITDRGGGTIGVHIFGACHPTACDNGTTKGIVYSKDIHNTAGKGFTTTSRSSFAKDVIVGVIKGQKLVVTDFTHYTDGSGRVDNFFKDTFQKQ